MNQSHQCKVKANATTGGDKQLLSWLSACSPAARVVCDPLLTTQAQRLVLAREIALRARLLLLFTDTAECAV